jgi:hypothetical protein
MVVEPLIPKVQGDRRRPTWHTAYQRAVAEVIDALAVGTVALVAAAVARTIVWIAR